MSNIKYVLTCNIKKKLEQTYYITKRERGFLINQIATCRNFQLFYNYYYFIILKNPCQLTTSTN